MVLPVYTGSEVREEMCRGALRPARAQCRAPMRSLRPYLQEGSAARALETLASPKVFDSLVRLLCSLARHGVARVRAQRTGDVGSEGPTHYCTVVDLGS